jgi:glutamate carboxypeptidase
MHKEMHSFLEGKLPHYLKTLRQMVAINSFTANPEGVNALGNLTAEIFADLGFDAEQVQSVNPNFGKHLVLTRPGSSGRKIGLISHLDTVFPPEEEIANDFHWRQDGDRIYGPGTNDIKGGTVMIYMMLDALKRYAPQVLDEITWVILINASEETLSEDFGDLCKGHLTGDTLAALVFEAGRYNDNTFQIVAARKGMAVYEVTTTGKASHAGSNHKAGANAIVQMAKTIQKIAGLTDYEQELTFNVGTVSGGTVPNRVPHHAEAKVEMRTFSPEVFDVGVASMLSLNGDSQVSDASGEFHCGVKVELVQQNAPWAPNPKTDHLLSIWQAAGDSLGVEVLREERGGLSDGNHIWRLFPTIDGLGPSGANAHCSEGSTDGSKEQEYATISSFVPKAVLNTVAVLNLIQKG